MGSFWGILAFNQTLQTQLKLLLNSDELTFFEKNEKLQIQSDSLSHWPDYMTCVINYKILRNPCWVQYITVPLLQEFLHK